MFDFKFDNRTLMWKCKVLKSQQKLRQEEKEEEEALPPPPENFLRVPVNLRQRLERQLNK